MAAADSPAGVGRIFTGALRIALGVGVGLWLLAGIVLVVSVSRNRALQVDEVEHVHAAYHMVSGRLIYRDFPEYHHPLLYYMLAPLVDVEDPVGTFVRARGLSLAALAGTFALITWCGVRLGGPLGGMLAGGLSIFHTTLVERGIETRSDGFLALCLLMALAVELRGPPTLTRRVLVGLALAAGFLFTPKAVFVCVAFGLRWLLDAWRERRPALVVVPVVAWALPVAMAAGMMLAAGNFEAFFKANVHDVSRVVSGAATYRRTFSPVAYLLQEGSRNLVFWLAVGIGAAALPLLHRRGRLPAGALFVGFVSLVQLASLWLNPFPFPYLHVTVVPVLAVTAALAAPLLGELLSQRTAAIAVAVALVMASFLGVPRLLYKATPGLDAQRATLREIQRVTAHDDAIFDLVGLYFRPDAYSMFTLTGNGLARYHAGGFPPMVPQLRAHRTMAVIVNYRTAWLDGEEDAFLRERFVHYDGNILLHGRNVSGLAPGRELAFEALDTRTFRYDGDGGLLVDGQPFRRGVLAGGVHRLGATAPIGAGRLILDTPPPVPFPPRPPSDLFVNFD